MQPAQLIAQHLAALPHPDGSTRNLPGFSHRLLPEPIQKQVSKTAQDIGECIVHLLEQNGYYLTTEKPSQPTQTNIATVVCNHCSEQLLQFNITHPERVATSHHYTTTPCPNK